MVLPIRMALVSSMLRNSSRRDPRALEISGFSEARVLLRKSEPYFCFTKRDKLGCINWSQRKRTVFSSVGERSSSAVT